MEPSRTFGEFLIIPNLTKRDNGSQNVSLKTPLVKFTRGQKPAYELEIPFISAAMQSVSGEKMAHALAAAGGIATIFCSQTVEDHAKMAANIRAAGTLAVHAVNTHDYRDRIPALVNAGAEILCLDSSDGFSEWQSDVIKFVHDNYGDKIKIGAGNVVAADGFRYLADAGADFIKIGIGGGSICITREQKGIGRGQASAVIDVAAARDAYFAEHGIYVPICSDGGIVYDNHVIMALAMGADFVMMGRYFAQFDESPSKKTTIDGKPMKEYWGEGSARARNWQRYGKTGMVFVEGVDSYIPAAGPMTETLDKTIAKIKSTMGNCGSNDLQTFYKTTRLTVISPASHAEGSAHNVSVK